MISISDVVTRHPFIVAGALAACVYAMLGLPAFVKDNAWTHRLVIQIPGFGRYLLTGIQTNFVAAFAQLKKNKMTNPSALMLLKDISWYFPYRTAIARAHIGLKSGESLANVLEAESDIIGERNIQYFRFIEETGSDTEQLERLAILMNRDLDAHTERAKNDPESADPYRAGLACGDDCRRDHPADVRNIQPYLNALRERTILTVRRGIISLFGICYMHQIKLIRR